MEFVARNLTNGRHEIVSNNVLSVTEKKCNHSKESYIVESQLLIFLLYHCLPGACFLKAPKTFQVRIAISIKKKKQST